MTDPMFSPIFSPAARNRSGCLLLAILAGWLWALAAVPASAGVLRTEKFDDAGAAGRWSAEGDWAIGSATGGPGAAVSGSGVAATALAGNAVPSSSRRISLVGGIAISASSVSPRLRFRHWHHLSSGSSGRVQVRTGPAGWTDLGGGPVTGRSVGWEWVCLALDVHAGQTVEIGFLCETGTETPTAGWYLDDLEVIDGPESDYLAWRTAFFAGTYPDPAKEAGHWGDDADPDRDGCPNLLEFAMHRNPVVSDSELSPVPRIDGADFVIRFRETSAIAHDVSWLGFWSARLDQWLPGGIRYEPVEEKAGHRILEARIARNREEKMFFMIEAWRE